MTLSRWIALVFLVVCLAYGYTSYFVMDAALPPFMRRTPIWPSSFPKMLSLFGALFALILLFSPAKEKLEAGEIDHRRLGDYHLGQALGLLVLMVGYALCLRPLGFLVSTIAFLLISGWLLGERKLLVMVPVAVVTAVTIWYLVEQVLGIYLKPLPGLIGAGG